MLGHDEEWERERKGWATSRERWEEMRRANRENMDFGRAAAVLGCDEEWLRERARREWEREEQEGKWRDERMCVVM